jgi:DNA-binding NtrC family response regulator
VSSARILAVDDETSTAQALAEMLALWGHKVETAGDGTDALKKAAEFRPDVVLSDLAMPETDGLWLLRALKDDLPDCPVIFLTGRATIDAAVAAIREGAYDFIEKPVDPARLKVCIDRALEKKETLREVQVLRRKLKQMGATDFIGASSAMRRVFELIEKVAPAKASVAITGESGTGKEMVARSIHNLSPRRDKPFIAINCASIPATLDGERAPRDTSGARSPAPTSAAPACSSSPTAARSSSTRWERFPSSCRRSCSGCWRRDGSGGSAARARSRSTSACSAPPTATSRRRSAAGRFREDLFFRLNVFQIALPPLRERREDVPMLVQHFVEKFNQDSGKHRDRGHPQAMEVLRAYDWPGNIRELKNAVERAVILCDGELITRDHLPPDMAGKGPERHVFRVAYGLTLDLVEKEYILGSLQRNANNKARTAEILGVSEKTLYNKLNRYSAEARAAAAAAEAAGPSQPPLTQPASAQNR